MTPCVSHIKFWVNPLHTEHLAVSHLFFLPVPAPRFRVHGSVPSVHGRQVLSHLSLVARPIQPHLFRVPDARSCASWHQVPVLSHQIPSDLFLEPQSCQLVRFYLQCRPVPDSALPVLGPRFFPTSRRVPGSPGSQFCSICLQICPTCPWVPCPKSPAICPEAPCSYGVSGPVTHVPGCPV